jgi:hypothetical protein
MSPWTHILKCVDYKGEDNFVITADQIKASGKSWTGPASQFEPRLLCYQTSSDARPEEFKTKKSKEKTMQGRMLYSPTELNKEFKRLLHPKGFAVTERLELAKINKLAKKDN